jgi:hypothetical protein
MERDMESNHEAPEITGEGIERVLAFLPIFEPGYQDELYTWTPSRKRADGTWNMPYVTYSPELLNFLGALGFAGFIQPYDWMSWQEEASRYVSEPDLLKDADLDTLRKLITLHVRRDRFVEGHLSEMIENGHIRAILYRLKAFIS